MAGAYKWRLLSECDINDPFFDSLKYDYPEFENWYLKKAREEKQAFTYIDENGLGAFVMLKIKGPTPTVHIPEHQTLQILHPAFQ